MKFDYQVVIPCRYGSTRLPGKPLLEIGGKTLLQHVYESARESMASAVTVATDDERIEDLGRSFGAEVIMTSREHNSGTDRVTEIVKRKKLADDTIIVNVQGDEFDLSPKLIDQVATALHKYPNKKMSTLCEEIDDPSSLTDPGVVKVVRDKHDNALYFSRNAVPWNNGNKQIAEGLKYYKHIGLYAYRVGFLKMFSDIPMCELERTEKLEQLRALYNGYSIHVTEACTTAGIGIDTEDDLARARSLVTSPGK